jgi:hypothetical protein
VTDDVRVPLLSDKISLGDSFTPIGGSRVIYTVDSFVERPGMPLHVRLTRSPERSGTSLLMSVSALKDPRFFRRVAE